MTYDLAKKLKEKGFPQEEVGNFTCPHLEERMGTWAGIPAAEMLSPSHAEHIPDCKDKVFCPTLEEIIPACDGAIFSMLNLHRTDGAHQEQINRGMNWGVMGFDKEGRPHFCYGKTLKTAVANLWLALNNK